METKDLALAMSAVAVVFAATGPIKDIVSSVSAFKARFANARVEGLPDDEGPSLGNAWPTSMSWRPTG